MCMNVCMNVHVVDLYRSWFCFSSRTTSWRTQLARTSLGMRSKRSRSPGRCALRFHSLDLKVIEVCRKSSLVAGGLHRRRPRVAHIDFCLDAPRIHLRQCWLEICLKSRGIANVIPPLYDAGVCEPDRHQAIWEQDYWTAVCSQASNINDPWKGI